jgi:hypothetical protein
MGDMGDRDTGIVNQLLGRRRAQNYGMDEPRKVAEFVENPGNIRVQKLKVTQNYQHSLMLGIGIDETPSQTQ